MISIIIELDRKPDLEKKISSVVLYNLYQIDYKENATLKSMLFFPTELKSKDVFRDEGRGFNCVSFRSFDHKILSFDTSWFQHREIGDTRTIQEYSYALLASKEHYHFQGLLELIDIILIQEPEDH